MSEPIQTNPNIVQVLIDMDGISHATALRELADWLESKADPLLHNVSLYMEDERFVMTALVENIRENVR